MLNPMILKIEGGGEGYPNWSRPRGRAALFHKLIFGRRLTVSQRVRDELLMIAEGIQPLTLPRSGVRMQPTAQAVGVERERNKPRRGERIVLTPTSKPGRNQDPSPPPDDKVALGIDDAPRARIRRRGTLP